MRRVHTAPFRSMRHVFMVVAIVPISALAYTYTAETVAPIRKAGEIVAGSIPWRCAGMQCTGTGPSPTPSVADCNALARQVGVIRAYGLPQMKLNAAQLAQCNSGAAAAAPAVPKMATPKPLPYPTPTPGPSGTQQATRGFLSAKKPAADTASGAAGPESSPGAGKTGFAPPPPSSSASRAVAKPSGPASFTTQTLTVTGTGALAVRAPFSPRTFSAAGFTVTGTGALAVRAPFSPKTFTAAGFAVTGTGALR